VDHKTVTVSARMCNLCIVVIAFIMIAL